MRAMELTVSIVIIIIVLLVTMVSVLIFFRGGFQVTSGAMADIVNESSQAGGGEEGVIPNKIDECPNVFFGFWKCDYDAVVLATAEGYTSDCDCPTPGTCTIDNTC